MNASLLSKRWISLWKMMPVLEYVENSCPNMTSHGFLEFCRRSLQLHEATVLKTLTIKLKKQSVSLILPSCFPETVFKKLVVLKLHTIFCLEFDVSPPVCFRSLKSLHIAHVWFRYEESFCRLISSCPVLEDLLINEVRLRGRQRLEITNSPSLKYLRSKISLVISYLLRICLIWWRLPLKLLINVLKIFSDFLLQSSFFRYLYMLRR